MVARFFEVPQAGQSREDMLAGFRARLRAMVDPVTGTPFLESDIARATQEGSRWFAHFNAVDLAVLALHAKAPVLADQFAPSRSTSTVLRGIHAPLHETQALPATGATVQATALASPGATFVGSTTIPDAAAAFATTEPGLHFQLLQNVTTPANGIAGSDDDHPLLLVGVDTGERTNLPAGTKFKWGGNVPLSAALDFTSTEDGSGGLDPESDAELAARIEADIGHRPESGNNAHVRKWARQSSTAVEDGFVNATGKYAGTKLVWVTQKRGRQTETAPKGPEARIASAGTVARARAYLIAPASPVVPERVVSLVGTPTPEDVNLSIGLSVPRGRGLGWAQTDPWPLYSGGPATITAVADQTHITITTPSVLPSSTTPRRIMVWRVNKSRWEELRVTSIVNGGGNTWTTVLTTAPAHTLAVGDYISPAILGLALYGQAVERYFDGLGPGEVVDLETDTRGVRARRFVDPVEQYPQRAGSAILTTLQEQIPGTLSTGEVLAISQTTPSLPDDVADGPRMLVAGRVAVYPSD